MCHIFIIDLQKRTPSFQTTTKLRTIVMEVHSLLSNRRRISLEVVFVNRLIAPTICPWMELAVARWHPTVAPDSQLTFLKLS